MFEDSGQELSFAADRMTMFYFLLVMAVTMRKANNFRYVENPLHSKTNFIEK